jgi:hypothetical protein
MSFADDCRRARELWSFYASKHLRQPFVLWLDDCIFVDQHLAKRAAKKVKLGTPDPFWNNFPERLRAAWDQLEEEP